MAQASVVRPLIQVYQKPLHGSKPNFVERYLSAISLDTFFSFFKIVEFHICFVFVNMGPYVSQNFKTLYFSHSFVPISTKLYDKYVSHGIL